MIPSPDQGQRLLGSALTFSLGLHLVLIFGFLVTPAGKETLRVANRGITVLLTPATEAVPTAVAEAQTHQLGRSVPPESLAAPSVTSLKSVLAPKEVTQNDPTITLQGRHSRQDPSPVAAHATLEAEYIRRWQIAVEQFGNAHYRDAAKRHGNGDVRLQVRLDSKGTVRGIQVLSSSGVGALDRAAIETVERLAPFNAFPAALANSVTELDIIRTWQFRY